MLSFRFFLVILMTFGSSISLGAPTFYKYQKSLLSSNGINLIGIYNSEASEFRYDNDADGKIDQWQIQKGNISISHLFKDGKLSFVTYRKKIKNRQLILKFESNKQGKLQLVSRGVRILGDYHNSKPEFPGENVRCDSLFSSFFSKMDDVLDSSYSEQRQSVLGDTIQPSCKGVLDFGNQGKLRRALDEAFKFDITSGIEQNTLLRCLAKDPATNILVPSMVQAIAKMPLGRSENPLKIECVKSPEKGCGSAKWNEPTNTITIAVTEPLCAKDMQAVFQRDITHQMCHFEGNVAEGAIVNVTEKCLGMNSGIANVAIATANGDVVLATADEIGAREVDQVRQAGSVARSVAADAPPVSFGVDKTTQAVVVRGPAVEVAQAVGADFSSTSFRAPASVGLMSLASSLNSGFGGSTSSPSSAYASERDTTESERRTAGSMAFAKYAFENFFPSAEASTLTMAALALPDNGSGGEGGNDILDSTKTKTNKSGRTTVQTKPGAKETGATSGAVSSGAAKGRLSGDNSFRDDNQKISGGAAAPASIGASLNSDQMAFIARVQKIDPQNRLQFLSAHEDEVRELNLYFFNPARSIGDRIKAKQKFKLGEEGELQPR
jgi:hypothetical protein